MCARKHDADCPHLVGRYLPLDACRADTVVDRLGTVRHAIGEVHQLTVEAGACRVGVLGYGLAFDVVGRSRVRRAFRLVELDAYVSHVRLLFL